MNPSWETLVTDVAARLVKGRRVRKGLPHGGRLHMDRPVPFLCAMRCAQTPSRQTERLVTSHSSYVLATPEDARDPGFGALVLQHRRISPAKTYSYIISEETLK